MKVFKIIIVTLISCLLELSLSVEAAQFDAPYLALEKKNKDELGKRRHSRSTKSLQGAERRSLARNRTSSISWLMMSVGVRWAGKEAVNTVALPHQSWTKWLLKECVSGAHTRNRLAHRPELLLTQAAIRFAPDCCLYSGQDRQTDFQARR